MLKKLATHEVQHGSELFSLADKCAMTIEGRNWHSQYALDAGKADKPDAEAAAHGCGKKEKKAGSKDKPLAGSPIAIAVVAGGGRGPCDDKCPHQMSISDGGSQLSYPVLRKRERSLHTCAQDVQITRIATI
jgi:hypothetical protein